MNSKITWTFPQIFKSWGSWFDSLNALIVRVKSIAAQTQSANQSHLWLSQWLHPLAGDEAAAA